MARHSTPTRRDATPAQLESEALSMETRSSLETFLSSIRFWLAHARDNEVEALARLVAAEQARRRLAEPEAPTACGQRKGASSS